MTIVPDSDLSSFIEEQELTSDNAHRNIVGKNKMMSCWLFGQVIKQVSYVVIAKCDRFNHSFFEEVKCRLFI